jgi:hypothetical protein
LRRWSWRLAVESSVAELLDGDHVVFGIPRAGVPMDIHAMNVAALPRRAIETLFGRLPDLPADPWLMEAERERLRTGVEVWSRFRAFWRVAAGRPAALRRSSFIGEVLTPGRMRDSENIDWSVAGGHVALCVSYANAETSVRSRRSSPRGAARTLLRLLLPALKAGVTMRLAHDQEVTPAPSLARLGLTRREAQVARLLARRSTNPKSPNSSASVHTPCGITRRTSSRSWACSRAVLSPRSSTCGQSAIVATSGRANGRLQLTKRRSSSLRGGSGRPGYGLRPTCSSTAAKRG